MPIAHEANFETRWVKPTHTAPNFNVHRKMNRMTPVVLEDVVLQGNNLEELVLISRRWGRQIWKKSFKGGVEAGALVFKDRVYVTANDGTASALDLKTGDTVWSFSSSTENLSSPVLDTRTGFLYFHNAQNIVFGLDAQNGRQMWVYAKPDNSLLTIRGAASPLVFNGVVYVGFSEGSFVALNAQSGQVIWEQNLNRNKRFKDIDARAVPYKDTVLISGYDDKVYALRAETGQIVWTYPAGSYSAVTLWGEDIFVSTTDSRILRLKADSGELVSEVKGLKGLATESVVMEPYLIFGESQGLLKAIDLKSGRLAASFEPGRGVFSKPAVDEKTKSIFFISGEANLYHLSFLQNVTEPFHYIP
ncbi:MAG: PQQ-binding-like beta-propeller repeat protein [Bdellovibrionales bacterium]